MGLMQTRAALGARTRVCSCSLTALRGEAGSLLGTVRRSGDEHQGRGPKLASLLILPRGIEWTSPTR
jgi:hypothetical protein